MGFKIYKCATEGCNWRPSEDDSDIIAHYVEEHDGEFPPKS